MEYFIYFLCPLHTKERVGTLQPREGKAPGGLNSGLSIPEESLQESLGGTFIRAGSDRTRRNGFKL